MHALCLDSGLCTISTASSNAHLSGMLICSLRVVPGLDLVPRPQSCLWSCAMHLCMLPHMSTENHLEPPPGNWLPGRCRLVHRADVGGKSCLAGHVAWPGRNVDAFHVMATTCMQLSILLSCNQEVAACKAPKLNRQGMSCAQLLLGMTINLSGRGCRGWTLSWAVHIF